MISKEEMREQIKQLESERIYDLLLDMLTTIGFDGYFKTLNPSWERVLGYTVEELLAIPYIELVHPDDVEATKAEAAKIAEGAQAIHFENRYRCKDGSYKWLSWNAVPYQEENIMYATARDITQRKQTEQALRDSQSLLQAFLDNFPDIAFVKDVDGNVIVENRQLLNLFGGGADTLIGKTVYDLVPGEFADKIWASELDVIETGEVIRFEELVPVGDMVLTKLTTKFPLYDAKGKILGLGGVSIDITEQKQAESEREQLIVDLNRLKAVLDNTTDFVSMTDMEGNVVYTNRAGMEMIGRGGQDPLTTTVATYHPPEVAKRTVEEHIPIVMEEGVHVWESVLQHIDGHTIPVSQVTTLIRDESGQPVGMGTIMRDLTTQREAEAERERLQQGVIDAQRRALQELSTPIIPIMDRIIVMPLIGSIDTMRSKEITRALLGGISEYRARVVILDITGVPIVDSGVASHLNKTIQAARLKGAHTIVTGIADAVAETVVELGLDWSNIETLDSLQTGLLTALQRLGFKLTQNQ